jgi:hypothetical protein
MTPFLIVCATIGVFVAIMALAAYNGKKHRERIAAFFQERGGEAWAKPEAGVQLRAFAAIGNYEELRSGPAGVRWAACLPGDTWVLEHMYTTGSGKSRQTHINTIASVPAPEHWPRLLVRRQHFLDNIVDSVKNLVPSAGALSKDMTLDNADFNKTFRVQASDENFALVFLTPEVQEWMLAAPAQWSFLVHRGTFLVICKRTLKLEELPTFSEAPAHVLQRTTPELMTA